MSLSIPELRDELEKAKERARSVRNIADEKAKRIRSLGTKAVASYFVGRYEQNAANRGERTFSLGGMGFVESVAAVTLVGGEVASGEAGEVLRDVGEAMLCVGAYKAGQRSQQR